MNKQVKFGAVLSYILILLNATYGIFLTPFIVGQLGNSSYGVYKTISSLTASFMVLDSGVGATIMRYVAKYRADKEEDKIPNFLFMSSVQVMGICGLIIAITFSAFFALDGIYGATFTAAELQEAKSLYIFLALGMLAHILENFINGIISGYNRFVFANGSRVIRFFIRILSIIFFLSLFKSAITLVVTDLVVTLAFILVEVIYLCKKIGVRIKFSHWDGFLFKESLIYVLLLLLDSLINQAYGNVSNVMIGAMISSAAVTIYSMAVMIFNMYMGLSTAISGVMLPTVTMSLKNDDEKYTNTLNLVVKAGRIQFLLLGAIAVGFAILGIPFIDIWLGEGYYDVYILTCILIFPTLLELCINVCLSILRAKNKMVFKTVLSAATAVLNLIITVALMPHIKYFAAAIGTAFSLLLGSVIIMGIYYYKQFKINVLTLYRRIFKGIIWCILLSGAVSYFVATLFDSSIYKLMFGGGSFCVVYTTTLLLFGLNKQEKNTIKIGRSKS